MINGRIEKHSPFQWLIVGGLFPLLICQAIWVRMTVPKLAEAKGPREGIAGRGAPLRILVVGDSSAAGVGVSKQTKALVGQLVSLLTGDFNVYWKLIATTGWTTAELRRILKTVPSIPYDVVLTASGVNDITSRHSVAACLIEQIQLVELLRERFAVQHIIISGLPPVHRFPSLPQPLRWYLGVRAKRLDTAIRTWAGGQPDCEHIPMNFPLDPDDMALDGFHPGAGIYALWGQAAAAIIKKRWR
ncbi:MAG: SGNH/GDSL hydrolase family protein [Desulfobacterales bacterium]|nr:SGNH/GDSL hydrolase family protein [Desulfobacterales bacterium]